MSDMTDKKPFGYLFIVDAYGCQEDIDDVTRVYDFLEESVRELGVSMQAPPYVFHSPSQYVKDGKVIDCSDKAGISAWVPLLESGIQCHTLTDKQFVSIDFYSCSKIDTEMRKKLLEVVNKRFLPNRWEHKLIERGKDYYN